MNLRLTRRDGEAVTIRILAASSLRGELQQRPGYRCLGVIMVDKD